MASSITNDAIKMKFNGTLSVICPTENLEVFYGNKRLDSFLSKENGALGKDAALEQWQSSIRNAWEIYNSEITEKDPEVARKIQLEREENLKMLIFDATRDVNDSGRPVKTIQQLDLVSKIDTQHNYIIEFEGGDVIRTTIKTPLEYYEIKSMIELGGLEIDGPNGTRLRKPITKIYEDISRPRELSAYNVRFSRKPTNAEQDSNT